jgi:hypothetical protein
MSYFIWEPPGHPPQVWKIEDHAAIRIGVSNAKNGPNTYFEAEPGETIWDRLKRAIPSLANGSTQFHRVVLEPGQFYPRIARPINQHPHESPGWSPGHKQDQNFITEARTQLIVLGRQLDRICRTVHPELSTLNAFGHDIRNLIILACTEVENHWRGVLAANGLIKERYDTRDYVKLVPAMALGEYKVSFKNYPWLHPFDPFHRWGTSDATTKDLPWYAAYNAVKHDRETHFGQAKLMWAFDAVSACAILLAAQFGLSETLRKSSDLTEMFHFAETPRWPLEDIYIYPYGEKRVDWDAVNYPFSI